MNTANHESNKENTLPQTHFRTATSRQSHDATYAFPARSTGVDAAAHVGNPSHPAEYPTRAKLPKGTLPVLASEVLVVNDLHWWTMHLHILQAAFQAGVKLRREDITSSEHKVNGKTKGSFYLTCQSIPEAQKLAAWFKANEFQGRKVSTAFVAQSAVQTLKTPAAVSNAPRPVLGTGALAQHPPTNAHGGINFNRLRQYNRGFGQGSGLGLGHPSGRGQTKSQDAVPLSSWIQNPWSAVDTYHIAGQQNVGVLRGVPYAPNPDWDLLPVQGEFVYH